MAVFGHCLFEKGVRADEVVHPRTNILVLSFSATAVEANRQPDLSALECKLDALSQADGRLEADMVLLRRTHVETHGVHYDGPPAGLGAYLDSVCVKKGKEIHVRGIETVAVVGVDVTTSECRLVIDGTLMWSRLATPGSIDRQRSALIRARNSRGPWFQEFQIWVG